MCWDQQLVYLSCALLMVYKCVQCVILSVIDQVLVTMDLSGT